MSALDWAIAILFSVGLLNPARLDLCGKGAWHSVAVDESMRCGFITTGNGSVIAEGVMVTLLAGEINVAVGTYLSADNERCLAGMERGLNDGG